MERRSELRSRDQQGGRAARRAGQRTARCSEALRWGGAALAVGAMPGLREGLRYPTPSPPPHPAYRVACTIALGI